MYRDEPTQYFRRYGDNDTEMDTDYYYDGISSSSYSYPSYSSSYDYNKHMDPKYSESRRYSDNKYADPRYIPPYDPHNQSYGRDQSRYPQTYHDPYAYGYDYYDLQRYQRSSQRAADSIPPYEPDSESRRYDNVGTLNSDLFKSKTGYSNPFAQKYERKYTPPTNSVYSRANPIVGGLCNSYTRPPVPRDPQINWGECLNRDKSSTIPDYKPFDEYDYVCAPHVAAPRVEESWSDIAKRNFPMDDNL